MSRFLQFLLSVLIVLAVAPSAWTAKIPTYTVAIDAEYAPYEFSDSVGRPSGFTVALLQEIGRRAGINFRFEAVSWPEAVAGLESGRFDLVNMIQTPARKARYALSLPHSRIAQGLFIKNSEHGEPNCIEKLAGHTVVVQQDDIALEELRKREDFAGITMRLVRSKDEGLLLLEVGKADAFFAAEQSGLWLIKKYGFKTVHMAAANLFPQDFGFAARKERGELVSLLNSHLQALRNSNKYSELMHEYLLPVPEELPWIVRQQTGLTVAAVLLVAGSCAFLAWNLTLKRAIRRCTQQCRDGEERFRSLFRHLPVSVWEEDFSGIRQEFDRLRSNGVTDFRRHFQKYPEELERCAARIVIRAINDESCAVFGAANLAELLENPVTGHFCAESWPVFLEEMVALAEGETRFESEIAIRDYRGMPRTLIMRLSVDPGNCETLARVLVSFLDVTERRKAKNELIRLKKAVETSSEIIFTADSSGVITYVNPSFTRVYGYRADEVVGRLTPRILKSGFMTAYEYEQLWKTLQDGSGIKREFINRAKDGTILTVVNAVNPVMDDAGNISGFLAVQSDISERKKYEQHLIESETRMRVLLEAIPDAVFFKDGAGRWLLINKAASDLFHIGTIDYVNKTDLELAELVPERREQLLYCITTDEQVWMQKELTRFEECVPDSSGALRYFDTIKLPLFTLDGKRHRMVIVGRDITERTALEARIQKAHSEWVETFDIINDAITIHDRDFNVIRANKSAEKLLGTTADSIRSHRCFESFHCAASPLSICPAVHAMRSGTATVAEIYEPNLGKHLEVRAIPRLTTNGEVECIIHVVRDITERKQLEAQLRHSQKMEAIGQLAGGIAHDFNNILTVITGYGGLMQGRMAPDDPQQRNLEMMNAAVERATNLTRSLLTFSRKSEMKLDFLDLNEVMAHVEQFLGRVIGDTIQLTLTPADRSLPVHADRGQLEQVIINLAANARDAMPAGGRLHIALEHRTIDDEFVHSHGYGAPGDYALVVVSDSGEGMSAEVRERIFEPFFTTKEPGKGTGLGMAIVYGIVKQHGGYINVYSEPGIGTVFTVYLPLHEAGETAAAALSPSTPPVAGTETILIIEDHADVRAVMRDILTESGYQVICAVDGVNGIELFNEHHREIRLIIMDVMMPNLKGPEAAAQIRLLKPDIRILFVSGYTTAFMGEQGYLSASEDVIMKPLRPQQLLQKVREMLNRE